MSRANHVRRGREARERRAARAMAQRDARLHVDPTAQVRALDARLGAGVGAAWERARLAGAR